MHAAVEVQETPERLVEVAPVILGRVSMAHAVPFQDSAKAPACALVPMLLPTVLQEVGKGQEIELRIV